MPSPTKAQLVEAIAAQLKLPCPPMSTGAKEPKAILSMVVENLGIAIDTKASKPALAEAICEAGGVTWTLRSYARGNTITNLGLQRILEAVETLTEP